MYKRQSAGGKIKRLYNAVDCEGYFVYDKIVPIINVYLFLLNY